MNYVLLLRPSEALQKTVDEAAKKLAGIHQVKVEVDSVRNTLDMAKQIDAGRRYGAIIIEQTLEEIEANFILNLYHPLKYKPPMLLSKGNYEKFVKQMHGADLTPVFRDFNRDFIYDYFKEKLVVAEKKIDIRIIKEVLLSVTTIVHENTQVKLDALGLSEIRSKDSRQEMSSIIAFIGDGVMGTLSIATTTNLISLFCQKMLYCEPKDVTPAMRTDVLNELSNQILGAFRLKLSQDGYELAASMQIVVSGEKPHLYQTKTNGHYYYLKFKHEEDEFLITFAYGTYQKQKGESNFARSKVGNMVLDVRIVNGLIKSVQDVVNIFGEKPKKIVAYEQKGIDYTSDSIHLLHGRGASGSFLVALDMPLDTVCLILAETMGIKAEDANPEIINDVCGELINQIAGGLKKATAHYGYDFINVYHGGFCAEEKLHYLLKNQGLYLRLDFALRDKPFTVCFGMEGGLTSKTFDLWSYIKSLTAQKN